MVTALTALISDFDIDTDLGDDPSVLGRLLRARRIAEDLDLDADTENGALVAELTELLGSIYDDLRDEYDACAASAWASTDIEPPF